MSNGFTGYARGRSRVCFIRFSFYSIQLLFDPTELATCNQGSHKCCESSRSKLNTLFLVGRCTRSGALLMDRIGTLLKQRYAPFELKVRRRPSENREECKSDGLAVLVGSFG